MHSKYSFCCIRQNISLPTCKFHEWILLLFPDRSQSRKNTQKNKVPTPQEEKVNLMTRLDELPNFNNPVYGMTSAVTWTDTDCHRQRTQQTSLIKASCCTTMHVKHELSLLFPRGWDALEWTTAASWYNSSTDSLYKMPGFPRSIRVTSLVKC